MYYSWYKGNRLVKQLYAILDEYECGCFYGSISCTWKTDGYRKLPWGKYCSLKISRLRGPDPLATRSLHDCPGMKHEEGDTV